MFAILNEQGKVIGEQEFVEDALMCLHSEDGLAVSVVRISDGALLAWRPTKNVRKQEQVKTHE